MISRKYCDHGKLGLVSHFGKPPIYRLFKRSSIIPYFRDKDTDRLCFILARDRMYFKDLTDFGGRNNGKENWKENAMREFLEESYGVLGFPCYRDMDKYVSLYSQKCTVSFFRIPNMDSFEQTKQLKSLFRKVFELRKKNNWSEDLWEKCEIIVVDQEELEDLICGTHAKFSISTLLMSLLNNSEFMKHL